MKYHIIRKLDDSDSSLVNSIYTRIENVAHAVNWKHVEHVIDADYIIAIGGDGTMLHAMRMSTIKNKMDSGTDSIPVIGFNIGKVGFLAEFQPGMVEETIIDIVNGKCTVDDHRDILYEKIFKKSAINEFLISPVLAKDTLKYEFFVDGVSSGFHHASGLIISTPTGSTAFSLSVGGAIVQPNAPVFQIVPVAPMSLNSRSVIVSNQSNISVKVKRRRGVSYNLISDGMVAATLEGGETTNDSVCMFEFAHAKEKSVLLHGLKWNFFDVLQNKLHWNQEI